MMPAWKSGMGMLMGAALLLIYWFFFPAAKVVLLMAILAALWGVVWVFLQQRANATSELERSTSSYQAPTKGKFVVLSRVRRGFAQGLLLSDQQGLFWLSGARPVKPGESLALDQAPDLLLTLEDISSFRHVAGLWGGGTLELHGEHGKHYRLQLADPEGLALLGDLISSSEEALESS